jgi:hypothetical protein
MPHPEQSVFGQDVNSGPPRYEAVLPTTIPRENLKSHTHLYHLNRCMKTGTLPKYRDSQHDAETDLSLKETDRRFRGAYCLHTQGERPYPSYETTWRNIPEGRHLHITRRENLDSQLIMLYVVPSRRTNTQMGYIYLKNRPCHTRVRVGGAV